jgi:hypothetical protein
MKETKVAMNGKFTMIEWKEEVANAISATQKLSTARVQTTHEGALTGELVMSYTMIYSAEGNSKFNGVGVFEGSVMGEAALYALIETGTYAEGKVSVEFFVYKLSGETELGQPIGRGNYRTSEHTDVPYYYEQL